MEKIKKTKRKSSDPRARSGERPGRGHGSELFVFLCFFGSSMVFCSLAKNLEKTKKTKKKVQTHGQGLGYPRTNIKKTKNQKTKKPKNQKNCFFLFFCFFVFLVSWFFGFLVCVWIAIADVPSRDCQALSVVALEARSIHYSTAMFAMT